MVPLGGQKVSFAGSVEEVQEEPSCPGEAEKPGDADGGEAEDQQNQDAEEELEKGDPPPSGKAAERKALFVLGIGEAI